MSTVTKNVKKFMEQDKQGIITPIIIQQSRMKINHLNHQLTGGLHVPSRNAMPLGGVGPEHAQGHLLKRRKISRFEERHVAHLLENLVPHAGEDAPLLAVRLDQPHPS